MKKLLFLLPVLLSATVANAMQVGDPLPTFKIVDQFGKEQVLSSDTKTIMVTSSKVTSEIIKDYLLEKGKGFLERNSAYYVADISGMPSVISKLFAVPKMKDYPFSILLVDKKQAKTFSKKEDQITIYTIENGKVLSINYIKEKEELASFFK
ncbi:MAG: hypothetical protein CSA22_02295 [Deltaproteobacteria bacterium]|nr:MAG: hypothetical protein CSA22_02295 [Deltaproteobacteria bacterium]